uniref:Uncharacterized protein n=1 Tax=Haemonchus placei TaxID=6290 RepID=A0A158QPI4_HAEPC
MELVQSLACGRMKAEPVIGKRSWSSCEAAERSNSNSSFSVGVSTRREVSVEIVFLMGSVDRKDNRTGFCFTEISTRDKLEAIITALQQVPCAHNQLTHFLTNGNHFFFQKRMAIC